MEEKVRCGKIFVEFKENLQHVWVAMQLWTVPSNSPSDRTPSFAPLKRQEPPQTGLEPVRTNTLENPKFCSGRHFLFV